MKRKGVIQKQVLLILVFAMLLGAGLQGQTAFAEGLERVDTQITDFSVTTSSGEIPPDGFSLSNALRIGISWDASVYQNNLKEGDYFNVILPKEFIFPEDHSACNFDIKDGNDVVAQAVVTPDPTNGGGVIKVTFTKYVEDKYHIKGSMFLNATFNKTLIKQGEINVISVAIGSHPTSIEINVKPQTSNPLNDEALTKWSRNKLFNGHVRWEMRINHKKGNLSNAIITDELSSEDGDMTGIHYIPDSFKLMEIQADEYGNTTWTGTVTNVSNDVVLSDNNTKFTYRLGDISGKQYFLSYDTTYKPNIKLHNKVTLANEQETWASSSSAVFAESGGQGSGDLLSKIKIIKVDSEDNEIKLAGAIFEVTRLSDNTTFTLTTNNEGEILSDKLIPGKYKIKETTQPVGYILNDETFEVDVTADGACIQTIKNEPVKTNITVEKRWIGEAGSPVTAILKADGTEVDRHELTAATSWKHTFENLRKYQPGTDAEIAYTVEEEVVPQGYTVSYETDPTGVLVIKNTQDKTEIKVTKAWEDNNDQDGKRPASVTIKLFADGEEVSGKTLTLTEANNWTGTFTDLDKYKEGTEINYTVKEEPVGNGYVSVITGTAEDGYQVTNTREPEKINVEGKKTWNDKDNQDGKRPAEITINLLKNGTKIDSVKVKEADGWKWKFEGLDKYENGNEITYSITEEQVEGYSAEINGYDVKNSYTPGKTSIQVTKAWKDKNDQDGVRPTSVTIKLFADGKETGKTLTLTKANHWTGTFTDLDEYKAGKKIKYTIKEEPVGNGYESVITGTAGSGYIVTNSRNPWPPTPPTPTPPTPYDPPAPRIPSVPQIPSEPPTPSSPQKPVTTTIQQQPKPEGPIGKPLPKTGEVTAVPYGELLGLLAGTLGFIGLKRKRED